MGQTLTHGIYLPDEGERNCYDGLASNWSILDGAVGTVAQHTSQIAGKAPLSHTHTKSDVTDLLNSNFIPSANNSYDLGSSSYQWNNLYAKKTNTDTVKAGTGTLTLQSNGTDKSIGIYNGDGATDGGGFWAYGKDHSNGSLCRIQIYNTSKSRYERVDLANSQFSPTSVELDLGDSTHRWKSFNGINPGALSLPSGGTTENTDWFNVAGNILPTGGDATNFTGGQNFFTPSKDGWLALSVASCESVVAWVVSLKYGLSVVAPNAGGNQQLIIPVVAGKQVEIKVKGSRWLYARLIVTQGNV